MEEDTAKGKLSLAEIGVWKNPDQHPTTAEWYQNGGMFHVRTKRDDGTFSNYVRYFNDDKNGYWVLPTAQEKGSWNPNNSFTEWLSPFVE